MQEDGDKKKNRFQQEPHIKKKCLHVKIFTMSHAHDKMPSGCLLLKYEAREPYYHLKNTTRIHKNALQKLITVV